MSSAFQAQPQPETELGRYRILSPNAGVRVSPICLGLMSLGQAWSDLFAGGTNDEEAFKFLDAYFDAGGNFVDTASNYQNGESETILGKWMAARQNRGQIVVATKFTMVYVGSKDNIKQKVNYQGNHRKNLRLSVQDSLAKLQTDYIDVLYLHWWDYSTSIPEIMNALDALVKNGKVLYLGVSDTPAWIVVKANEYARQHGMTQFSVYQGLWSLHQRDVEREILPMCKAEGMAFVPWGVVGQGKYKTPAEVASRSAPGQLRYFSPQTDTEKAVSAALAGVASEIGGGASLVGVAIAWALAKAPYVFPIVGGRSCEQLAGNIEALKITLTPEQISRLESSAPFEAGFPYNLFGFDPAASDGRPGYMINAAGWVKYVKHPGAIEPGA